MEIGLEEQGKGQRVAISNRNPESSATFGAIQGLGGGQRSSAGVISREYGQRG